MPHGLAGCRKRLDNPFVDVKCPRDLDIGQQMIQIDQVMSLITVR
jgi:hypothetical protein